MDARLLPERRDRQPPRAAGIAVLAEVDPLPGADVEGTVAHRQHHGRTKQRRLDVRRHVVRSLRRMGPERGVLWHGVVEPRREVPPHVARGVLVQRQRRRGMPDEHVRETDADVRELRHAPLDLTRDQMEAARHRLERDVALHPDHPDSLLTVTATDEMMTAAPTSVVAVTFSDRIDQPRKIATTGFTYAYVVTFEIGAFWSSQT